MAVRILLATDLETKVYVSLWTIYYYLNVYNITVEQYLLSYK